jgi:hypothetical protein
MITVTISEDVRATAAAAQTNACDEDLNRIMFCNLDYVTELASDWKNPEQLAIEREEEQGYNLAIEGMMERQNRLAQTFAQTFGRR